MQCTSLSQSSSSSSSSSSSFPSEIKNKEEDPYFIIHCQLRRKTFLHLLSTSKLLSLDSVACPKCGYQFMQLVHNHRILDGFVLECSHSGCRKELSIRHDSFFQMHDHIPLEVSVDIIHDLESRHIHSDIAQTYRLSRETISHIHVDIVERVRKWNEEHPVKFGNNEIVEIDCNVNDWKGTGAHGEDITGDMIFGMISRQTKKIHLECVESESSAAIIPILQTHCEQNTLILHDKAKAYDSLHLYGFLHATINKRREGFARFDEVLQLNVNVNHIENVWREKEAWILHQHGAKLDRVKDFVHEFMFVWNGHHLLEALKIQ